MEVVIPDLALVVLVGPSGSGKSTFAQRHFLPTEVVSSDRCRALVADDEADQSVTAEAFELVHAIAEKRLAQRRLTLIDATSVRARERAALRRLARRHHVPTVALVFDLGLQRCLERNMARRQRRVAKHVIVDQHEALRRSLPQIGTEGYDAVVVLDSVAAVESARVARRPLPVDRRDDPGPFDIIGDIHGCRDELVELLGRLGYALSGSPNAPVAKPPAGRRAIFLGDLVDRGPDSAGVLRLVMAMVAQGHALCVSGNHDDKLRRALRGNAVKVGSELAETLGQVAAEPSGFAEQVAAFLDARPCHYVLDGGALVVAHAGLPERFQGRWSPRVRAFALFGDATGEVDAHGLPVRRDWAQEYRGAARVVHGHTPVQRPQWVNQTLCLDAGCVFGGALVALRYPELEFVEVPAHAVHADPRGRSVWQRDSAAASRSDAR